MKNVIINGNSYNNVPYIDVPLSAGGGDARFYETSDATASAANILTGKKAYGASGEVSGNMANNGATGGTISTKAGSVTIPAGYTTGGSVSLASAAISDLIAANLRQGCQVLGVSGSLTSVNVTQDATTHGLTIS